MTSQAYQSYIESDHWKQLRKEFETLNTFCAACGSLLDLDVHHRDYSRLWNEGLEDLVRLDRTCHYSTHFFYKMLVADYYAGGLPFLVTLTEVTDFLLANPVSSILVANAWIVKNMEENNGWRRHNNFPRN